MYSHMTSPGTACCAMTMTTIVRLYRAPAAGQCLMPAALRLTKALLIRKCCMTTLPAPESWLVVN